MALGHNTTDTEETDEMMVPAKTEKTPNNNKQPCRSGSDPGHMNMKGVFLHVLSDALGKLFFGFKSYGTKEIMHLIVNRYGRP